MSDYGQHCERMAWVDALETQLAASRATAANLLSALVAELTSASANGAPQASPATPWENVRKTNEGLKARTMMPNTKPSAHLFHCADHNGSRLQRSGKVWASFPGALPQAGIGRAFGPLAGTASRLPANS
jgi:hypothetical protein